MPQISKRDLILDSIIKAYLEENLPIGSMELGIRMEEMIPASTIRVYFKKLSQEGALTQLHVSGGRVPTKSAMQEYWREKIDVNKTIFLNDEIKKIVNEYNIYCLVNRVKDLRLEEIINVENRFLLLLLGEEFLVLKYQEPVFRFLTSLIGASLKELESICKQVGLFELSDKASKISGVDILLKEGEMSIYEVTKESNNNKNFTLFLNPNFPASLSDGLYFEDLLPEGYMALKQKASFKGEEAELFCLGDLYVDYEQFLNEIKESS